MTFSGGGAMLAQGELSDHWDQTKPTHDDRSWDSLPPEVQSLPGRAQDVWLDAYHSVLSRLRDPEVAARVAWGAVHATYEFDPEKGVYVSKAIHDGYDTLRQSGFSRRATASWASLGRILLEAHGSMEAHGAFARMCEDGKVGVVPGGQRDHVVATALWRATGAWPTAYLVQQNKEDVVRTIHQLAEAMRGAMTALRESGARHTRDEYEQLSQLHDMGHSIADMARKIHGEMGDCPKCDAEDGMWVSEAKRTSAARLYAELAKKLKETGSIENLAKHFEKKYGSDPEGLFTAVYGDELLADYPEENRAAIAARVHYEITGKWPAEDRKVRFQEDMQSLAKHLAKKYPDPEGFFTNVVRDPELAGYDDDTRRAIAAVAHKLAIGKWPSEKKEASLPPTAANVGATTDMLEGTNMSKPLSMPEPPPEDARDSAEKVKAQAAKKEEERVSTPDVKLPKVIELPKMQEAEAWLT